MSAHCKKQSGFTLMELVVVITIILLLAAFFGPSFFGQTDDAKINVTNDQLSVAAPKALMSLSSVKNIETMSANEIQEAMIDRGVKEQTPWDSDWTVEKSSDGQGVYLSYNVGNNVTPARLSNLRNRLMGSMEGNSGLAVMRDVRADDQSISTAYYRPFEDEVIVTARSELNFVFNDIGNAAVELSGNNPYVRGEESYEEYRERLAEMFGDVLRDKGIEFTLSDSTRPGEAGRIDFTDGRGSGSLTFMGSTVTATLDSTGDLAAEQEDMLLSGGFVAKHGHAQQFWAHSGKVTGSLIGFVDNEDFG